MMHAGHHPNPLEEDGEGLLFRTGSANIGGSGYRDQIAFNISNMDSMVSTSAYFVGGRTGVLIIRTVEFQHPAAMPELLRSTIMESRSLLNLPDNWDGEGSAAYSESTWQRAVNFLVEQWTEFLKTEGRAMELPSILPDSNGSIDLWWDTEEFQLLISIPASELLPASLYGHKHGGQKIEYVLNSSKADERLVRWMAEREEVSPTKSFSPKKSPHPT